ncbi:hypothetical protein A2483_03685 [Candidatus Peregrinibacteria bacterium RIFOXYC2_FULL_33_13]|nr:MAG: MscS Mechanosensitive ion channel [Candidatus Peregrinibacteria bacterium GW2011_GWA2_33_10]KKP38480.1 MAG: hypothetical protein UR30_C0018G0007 [Candidatus Peregrinibacteria bacterium GW2011_GWC2_33_13]OGJ54399.1 MAG: hypothetical protein A2483_03685 [Candidatus Peregrinibacteria bacterium RIFOXYC2_FULL_33_13]
MFHKFLNDFIILQANALTSKAAETTKLSGTAVDELVKTLWERIDNWIAAIVVAVLAFAFAKMIRNTVIDRISQHIDEENQDILILAGRATYLGVLAVGITIALKVAGIDITAIIAAIGFGIGFALQDLLMNFISGVMILVSRQFNIGDFIKVGETMGQVQEIQTRCTILKALDGTKVIVPNKDLFVNQVTSFTTNPFRRIEIAVGVDYSTDLKLAVNTAMQTIESGSNILKEPKSVVLIDAFAESSINLILRFWVDSKSNWLGIRSEMIINLKKNFDAVHINIPFPIRTLYMANHEQEISKAMEESGMVPKMNADSAMVAAALTTDGTQIPINMANPLINIPIETQPEQSQTESNINSTMPDPKADIKDEKKPDTGANFLNNLNQK